MMRKSWMLAVVAPFLWACGDTAGPEGPGQVAVRFNAGGAGGASASARPAPGASFDHVPATGAITLTGSNGTLVIQDIQLIVSEIELERAEGSCATVGDDGCEEFEGGPFLVNLLDGTAEEVVSALVPAGSYTELEFEVENLDADEDDDAAERQTIESIFAQVRQSYPAFPRNASMVVHGTFDGEPFTVYFDAEIEVEQEFATAFRVPEDGAILVNLDPAAWFKLGDQVVDLRAFDGQTLQIEAEFERGVEVEKDD